jgi:integrase
VRQLPSGRWQARYTAPDGVVYKAPHTFMAKKDADAWLSVKQADVLRGEWLPEAPRRGGVTFHEFSLAWLDGRKVRGRPLAPRTRAHYESLLDGQILPTFGHLQVKAVTPDLVDDWYETAALGRPTLQAHSYALLRTILGTAVDRGIIRGANPAKIRGGGSTTRAKKVEPATTDQLAALVEATPDKYRLMMLLASWCAMRFGELAELRRKDINLKTGTIRIRRGVVRAAGKKVIGGPKSAAGSRDVAIPPHLLPMLQDHLERHAQPGADGLVFPSRAGDNLQPSTLYRVFYPAREAAGRPDLRFHDLRHTGAVLAAQAGATLAELMGRLGHATPAAALRYQHAAADRDQEIARRLSAMAEVQK